MSSAGHFGPICYPFEACVSTPCSNASLTDVALTLQSGALDRPVVDRSGLQGKWDFLLQWTPDESQFPTIPEWHARAQTPTVSKPDVPPDLYNAFSAQLGLKLVATKTSVEVFVIDHVERPSAN